VARPAGRAVAGPPHGHAYDRTLTVVCVLVGCLLPGQGYDGVLAMAFGLPGLHLTPGTTVSAEPARAAGRAGHEAGLRAGRRPRRRGAGDYAAWKGLDTTAIDGTTADLFSNDDLTDAFGVPAGGSKPQLRIVAHVRAGSRRWIAAAISGYRDGENPLGDELARSFKPQMINLADRGFFSMDRWLRFSVAGAHLAWRVKNGAESVPFKILRTLPDGSELVMLHESAGMRARRAVRSATRTPCGNRT